ncbi:MAG: hypothetical protein V1798_02405, partial [Pseudomonadota bacterium]
MKITRPTLLITLTLLTLSWACGQSIDMSGDNPDGSLAAAFDAKGGKGRKGPSCTVSNPADLVAVTSEGPGKAHIVAARPNSLWVTVPA